MATKQLKLQKEWDEITDYRKVSDKMKRLFESKTKEYSKPTSCGLSLDSVRSCIDRKSPQFFASNYFNMRSIIDGYSTVEIEVDKIITKAQELNLF